MAHEVRFSIPERELGSADIEFRVKQDGATIGKLKVSRGSIVWVKKDATYGYRLSWTDLAELFAKHGRSEKE